MILCLLSLVGTKLFSPYFRSGPSVLDANKNKSNINQAKVIKKPSLLKDLDININTESYIVLDRETLTPLVEKNSKEKLPLASITKLMTVLIALENRKNDETVQIKNDFSYLPQNKLGLFYGEKISMENLLYAALIPSANDAAEALAYYIGKGDYGLFLKMMNAKAKELGMNNTSFSNATGLDNVSNYSTVYDLVYLAHYALSNQFISEAVRLKEKTIANFAGDTIYNLKATNELLDDKDFQFFGLKTGKTPLAGECLVTLVKLKNGQEIITAVLGSTDRFGETKKLVQWIDENVTWK